MGADGRRVSNLDIAMVITKDQWLSIPAIESSGAARAVTGSCPVRDGKLGTIKTAVVCPLNKSQLTVQKSAGEAYHNNDCFPKKETQTTMVIGDQSLLVVADSTC